MASVARLEKFFAFLQAHEKDNQSFTLEDVTNAVDWKKGTFRTYISKHQLENFVIESDEPGIYNAKNVLSLNFGRFHQLISQDKNFRELGHKCKSPLSKSLLRKSKENMLLALEIYNRPSLENRVDSFAILFCLAWEQLLKSMIIEEFSDDEIFKKDGNKKFTISLRDCLKKLYQDNDGIRKNIETILDIRNEAAHLLVSEIQHILSRYFQSGIINYSKTFSKFSEQELLETSNAGLMTLVGNFNAPTVNMLKAKYGSLSFEIFELAKMLRERVDNEKDATFAIPINYSMSLIKKSADGTFTLINDINEVHNAVIIEKLADVNKTHPYTTDRVISKINELFSSEFNKDELDNIFTARDKHNNATFNRNCFSSVVYVLGLKNTDSDLHFNIKNPPCHRYSEKSIILILDTVKSDRNFLKKSKATYNNYLKSTKNKNQTV